MYKCTAVWTCCYLLLYHEAVIPNRSVLLLDGTDYELVMYELQAPPGDFVLLSSDWMVLTTVIVVVSNTTPPCVNTSN